MKIPKATAPTIINPVIMISATRIMILGVIMIGMGGFFGTLAFSTLAYSNDTEITAKIVAAVAVFGAFLAIGAGVRCAVISSVQLKFTDTGIEYRDVRKSISSRNKTGVGLRFYLTTERYFLGYEHIVEVKLIKYWLQCNQICLVTTLNEEIFLPILMDSCKEVDKIAEQIGERIGHGNHFQPQASVH